MKKFGLLLILAFTTFFSSCEKDLYEEAILKEEKRVEIKKVSLNNLDISKNQKLFDAVDKIRVSKRNVKERIVYDSINKIYFDDSDGREIESPDGLKTYTFQIISKDSIQKVENILFKEKPTGDYEIFKVVYNVTPEQMKTMTAEQVQQNGVSYISIQGRTTSDLCVYIITVYEGCSETHSNGYTCAGQTVTYSDEICAEEDTSFINQNNGDSGAIGTGWVNGNFDSPPANTLGGGVFTTPLSTPGAEFLNSLGMYIDNMISLTSGAQQIIYDYLTANNFDAASKSKVRYAIQNLNFDLLNTYPFETNVDVFNYITQNNFVSQTVAFMNQCLSNMAQNPNVFQSIKPFIIEKNIDDTALPPCSKNILSVIKNLSHNDFAKIIARLGSTDSINSVFINPIQNFNLNTGNLAETSIIDVNNLYSYNISIDSQYLTEGTKLSIASTILHELIHAYFYSLIADEYNTGNSTLNTFPELWDYYVVNMSNMTPGGSPQHLVMAQNYVNVLGEALQEFDTGVPVTSSNPLQQKYKDLAWGGLYGTIPYNSLSQSEKDRITAVNIAEETNSSQIENGTTHLPISTPCN